MQKEWGMSAKNLLYWNALLKMKRRKLDEAVSYVERLKKSTRKTAGFLSCTVHWQKILNLDENPNRLTSGGRG